MKNFMDSQNFINLIKNNTCFKGVDSYIDLILKSRKYCFKNTSSYETRFSDHHHLLFLIMNTTSASEEPKKFVYHDYKIFSHESFKTNLIFKTVDEDFNCSKLEKEFVDTLNKHSPTKKTKLFRGNQKRHVNKALRNAIMKILRLKNRANKTCKAVGIFNYKKQRNLVIKINKECKRDYLDNLNIKTTTKQFSKTCKLYLSNKHSHGAKNTLIEIDRIVSANNKIAKTFNTYFESVTDSLNLFEWIGDLFNSNDKIEQIIAKFVKHPSILKIKLKSK